MAHAPLMEEMQNPQKNEGEEYYFATNVNNNNKGGYQVKEYDIGNYDGGYSYDVSEYKSDYD